MSTSCSAYDGGGTVNVGCGSDVTIRELAEMVASVVGYSGRISFDASKPDGTPRKLLDVQRIFGMGWRPKVLLSDGIAGTYAWFRSHEATARR